jgi:hypothetical protein
MDRKTAVFIELIPQLKIALGFTKIHKETQTQWVGMAVAVRRNGHY